MPISRLFRPWLTRSCVPSSLPLVLSFPILPPPTPPRPPPAPTHPHILALALTPLSPTQAAAAAREAELLGLIAELEPKALQYDSMSEQLASTEAARDVVLTWAWRLTVFLGGNMCDAPNPKSAAEDCIVRFDRGWLGLVFAPPHEVSELELEETCKLIN